MVKHVVKRDGRVVMFDKRKIVDAILKAMVVTEAGEDIVLAAEIASAISKIEVEKFNLKKEGELEATFIHKDEHEEEFELEYMMFDRHVLVWLVG